MFISQKLDQAADSLDQINWKKVFAELIELRTMLFKGVIVLIIITYVAGETLGTWVHRTNDWLAHQWVRLIVPQTPTEVEQTPITVVAEEVSVPTPPTVVEVEPLLPPVAEVVEISTLQKQPPPVRRRRRSSAPRSLEETVNEEVEPPTTRRPRGPKAHRKRVRRTLAA